MTVSSIVVIISFVLASFKRSFFIYALNTPAYALLISDSTQRVPDLDCSSSRICSLAQCA